MSVQSEFGVFTWNRPCWESEPIAVPLFGGAEVRIQIFPEVEGGEDLRIAPEEVQVLKRFLALPAARAKEVIPHLWSYYSETRSRGGAPDVPEIHEPGQIWEHVRPRFIGLDRDENGIVYVSVEAECDWEIEHGLQLVLQNGDRWVRVSDYSGHLTDGRAWGKRSLDDWMADPTRTLPVRTTDELASM